MVYAGRSGAVRTCDGQDSDWRAVVGAFGNLRDYIAAHIFGGDTLIGAGTGTIDASGAVAVRTRTSVMRGQVTPAGDVVVDEPRVSTRTGVVFDRGLAEHTPVAGSAERDVTVISGDDVLSVSRNVKYLNAAKVAGGVGIGLGFVAAGVQENQDDSSNHKLSGGQRVARVAAAVLLEGGGAAVGGFVGARLGGALGGFAGLACGPLAEVCVPAGIIVGSVAGGVAGGLVGGWVGSQLKKAAFNLNPFGWFH
jgi:hypothetical protein